MAIPSNLMEVTRKIHEAPTQTIETDTPVYNALEEVSQEEEVFDFYKVQGVVNDIIYDYKEQGRSMELAVLKQPFDLRDNVAVFKLIGEIQKDIFNKAKPDILKLLRKKLNNYKIDLNFEINSEAINPGKKLYTSTDKLNYLREKSPALKELQKRFGLETDF
ncbi:hypothetical protein [Anditalea andensis]|uniref:DNA polymerase III subunit gamma/tau n=1 Tax=Anditalea andensis TaxID=1048983 RepID=A0A074L1I4_9BACT|nr:hypothetical protein [Anditalea andensis]KEO74365.1 hypothetical protein EL17_06410 [Anditalea andensis]